MTLFLTEIQACQVDSSIAAAISWERLLYLFLWLIFGIKITPKLLFLVVGQCMVQSTRQVTQVIAVSSEWLPAFPPLNNFPM